MSLAKKLMDAAGKERNYAGSNLVVTGFAKAIEIALEHQENTLELVGIPEAVARERYNDFRNVVVSGGKLCMAWYSSDLKRWVVYDLGSGMIPINTPKVLHRLPEEVKA